MAGATVDEMAGVTAGATPAAKTTLHAIQRRRDMSYRALAANGSTSRESWRGLLPLLRPSVVPRQLMLSTKGGSLRRRQALLLIADAAPQALEATMDRIEGLGE